MLFPLLSFFTNSSPRQPGATLRSQATSLNRDLLKLSDIAESNCFRPADIKNHSILIIADEFFNKPDLVRTDKVVAECYRNWLAARLCISSKTLQKNPGFEEFAEKNHLDRFLATYQHRLTIAPSGDVLIQIETDKLPQPWSKIRHDPTLIDRNGKLVGRYGCKGIMKESPRNWQTLPLFQFGDSKEWNDQYIFEICVRCPEKPKGLGDHVWFRLKNSKGEIYSIGMTSDKDMGEKTKHKVLKISKGFLVAPDYFEFCSDRDRCLTLGIAITGIQFANIKKTIELDQQEKRLKFQLMQSNCVTYTCQRIGAIAGLHLFPLEQYYFSLLGSWIAGKCEMIMPLLKAEILKRAKIFITGFLEMVNQRVIPRACLGISSNWLLLFFGATQVDKPSFTKEELESIHPLISSFSDFCNPDKSLFFNPSACRELIERIEKWRKNNPGNQYAVPPQFLA